MLNASIRRYAASLREVFADFRISPVADGALRDLLRTCARHGAHAALVLLPDHSTVRACYQPDVRPQVDAYLEELSRRYAAAVIDTRDWVADEDFVDSRHVLPHVAGPYTACFVREVLRPLMQGNPLPSRLLVPNHSPADHPLILSIPANLEGGRARRYGGSVPRLPERESHERGPVARRGASRHRPRGGGAADRCRGGRAPRGCGRPARGHLRLALDAERSRRTPRSAPRTAEAAEPTEEARQWSAARRIGEHLRPTILRRLDLAPGEDRSLGGVSLATQAAQHLLAPAEWFRDDARAWASTCPGFTSATARPAWRCSPGGCWTCPSRASSPSWTTTTCSTAAATPGASAGSWSWPSANASATSITTAGRAFVCADGWTVQGWPLHRPDWKREVLRSVGGEEDG